MTSVFISYRRKDSAQVALTISQYLARKLGSESVFLDVDGLGAGADYPDVLARAIGNSNVLIAIIGPNWIETLHRAQQNSSNSQIDWVVLEIGKAFDLGLKVVPVLVDGATMPSKDQLPLNIKALADRHAFVLSKPEAFRYEMAALATDLGAATRFPRRVAILTLVSTCIAVIFLIVFWRQSGPAAIISSEDHGKSFGSLVCRATATSAAGATGVGQAASLGDAEKTALRFCRNSGGGECHIIHSSCGNR